MADPVESETFVGSHEKSRAGYGTNGDPNPSSVPMNKQPQLVEPKVAPPSGSAEPWAGQTRYVGQSNVKAHDSMSARTIDNGSPGGSVPTNNRPVHKPATPGRHAR
jgi:hypothetical protein